MTMERRNWSYAALTAAIAVGTIALTPAAHAAGALAAGQCGGSASVVDRPNLDDARRAALNACQGSGAKECKVVATVRKGCFVMVIDAPKACEINKFAVAETIVVAANTAIAQCYTDGGTQCMLRQAACDTRG